MALLRFWDIHSVDIIAELHHGSPDAKVAWSPTGEALTSGGTDGALRVWDVWNQICIREIHCHDGPILKAVYLADGLRVISVSADQTAKICHLDNGECLRVFTGHTGEVNSVAVSGDQQTVLSASEDLTLRNWSIASGSCLATLYGHSEVVWRVAIAPNCRLAASGAADNIVMLWDLDTGACLEELKHPECVAAVTFSPDGERLVVGCDDAVLYVYAYRRTPWVSNRTAESYAVSGKHQERERYCPRSLERRCTQISRG
jgi:WD40 repeat protein